MAIDLTIPPYDPEPDKPHHEKRATKEAWQLAVNEGRAAYYINLEPKAPPFADSDMAASWNIGWYDAHSRAFDRNPDKEWRRCPKDCPHRRDPRWQVHFKRG